MAQLDNTSESATDIHSNIVLSTAVNTKPTVVAKHFALSELPFKKHKTGIFISQQYGSYEKYSIVIYSHHEAKNNAFAETTSPLSRTLVPCFSHPKKQCLLQLRISAGAHSFPGQVKFIVLESIEYWALTCDKI